MPMLDMPLAALKQYQGISPRPEDFDAYWECALKEMREVKPDVELIPAKMQFPNMECFDLYFTGVGGARIHAKYLRPKNYTGKLPALLQFHGYRGAAGDWLDKLAFASAGFAVVSMDCRGQSGYSEDVGGVKGSTVHGHLIQGLMGGSESLLFRKIFLDTAELADIVMNFEEIDETRVSSMGGSQGGALSIACAALSPRIYKAVVQYPFLSDFKRVWEMDLAKDAYEELRIYFRAFDPLHKHEEEIFTALGYIDVQNLAPRIRAKVLFGVTLMDTICPPSTQFAAYNKITSEKEMMIYPDYGHENLPGFWDEAIQFLL